MTKLLFSSGSSHRVRRLPLSRAVQSRFPARRAHARRRLAPKGYGVTRKADGCCFLPLSILPRQRDGGQFTATGINCLLLACLRERVHGRLRKKSPALMWALVAKELTNSHCLHHLPTRL